MKNKKIIIFFSYKISLYLNIELLSKKDVNNKILDLINNKFHSERQEDFNKFCEYISMIYGKEYTDRVFNEFIKDPSFNNMSRLKEL